MFPHLIVYGAIVYGRYKLDKYFEKKIEKNLKEELRNRRFFGITEFVRTVAENGSVIGIFRRVQVGNICGCP